ncbi:uncharacterized protein LOC107841322 [Capsicum annuum]|uniref:uncharacterized protein LOC107841322 n=1 Tax=Capsicum annuum TaxID=4072 RepID=UPI001FB19031|nr:uncharacterized protein LOC107841322 [Capsicum annuum]
MDKVTVIRERLKTGKSHQKAYVDMWQKELELEFEKCVGDPSLIVPMEDVGNLDSLSYEKVLVKILDREILRLRTKDVASMKVLWRNQKVEEATWEAQDDMRAKYLFLFLGLDEDV